MALSGWGTKRGLDRIAADGTVSSIGRAQGLVGGQVTAIVESSAGGLWVATDGGLHRITKTAVTAIGVQDGLPSPRVFSLAEDPDGTLWIGTNRGLSRYSDGVFQTISSKQGLFDDVVFSILDDGQGRIWMSSNKGIFSVPREDLSNVLDGRAQSLISTHFGRADGIETDQCNGLSQPSSWQTRDGRLLFPTVHGGSPYSIQPDLAQDTMAPPVVIEELKIDDKDVALLGRILLEPGRGERLEFRYTGLSLHSPEQVEFRYQLVGFDSDWVAAGKRRVAYYTKIPPGEYRFQVIAANRDGVWNQKGDSIAFSIEPFFFQTRWFPRSTRHSHPHPSLVVSPLAPVANSSP